MLIKGVVFILATLITLTEAFLFRPDRVCYGKYGCFERHPVWLVKFPQKPFYIETKFNLFTRDNRKSAQIIDDHDRLKLDVSQFNIARQTIFVIHGFTDSIKTWATQIKDALLDRKNCNVILVDWSKGSRFPYGQAAGNTRLVGAQTAELIRFLIFSYSGSSGFAGRFYIVGHSLGASVAGYAGSYLRARAQMNLGRITGLDPAGPYFTNVDKKFRLDESDARYVDVIHTDAGFYGTDRRGGHTDFYPNGGSHQPGCRFDKFDPCDHMRATEYYIASVIVSCSWTAYPCENYAKFEKGECLKCDGACPSMGYDADVTKKKGKFYLQTNSKAPFCGQKP